MKVGDLKNYRRFFKEYTELRIQENRNVSIGIVKGNIVRNSKASNSGISARVYRTGQWGFASDPNINDQTISNIIADATTNSCFLADKHSYSENVLPVRKVQSVNDFSSKKPRKSQKEKIEFLRHLDEYLVRNFKDLTSRSLFLNCLDMEKNLITSDGSLSYSMIPRTIIYLTMSVEKKGKPIELYNVYGGFGQYEDNFNDLDVLQVAFNEQYEHLKKKSEGIMPDSGLKDCILDADLAGILSHEAIGHTVEADIVMGGSIAADYLETQVASPLITMVDFAHKAIDRNCPVPVYVDDEGTEAKDAILIHDGVLKSYMHNKESALHFNTKPTGNARAFGFDDEPLIRMRNTAIMPGTSKLEEMINSIDDGYYLIRAGNGQADSTSEFMFGITLGYEIKKGKIGKAIMDTTISGVAFDMLKTVTMISDQMSWSCAGMCGKKQSIPVGMGGPAVKCKINLGGK